MFGLAVEGEGSNERRWGRVVAARRLRPAPRRLRGFGDDEDWSWLDFDQAPTAPANYVDQNPAQVPLADSAGGGDTPTNGVEMDFNANLQYDPSDPAGNTGFSQSQYNAILAAAQQAAQAAGQLIGAATHNSNGTFSCPQGYIFDPNTRQCYPVPSGIGGLGIDTNTLLMLGAGGLGLLAIFFLMK